MLFYIWNMVGSHHFISNWRYIIRFLAKSTCCFWLIFKHYFEKQVKMTTFLQPNTKKHTLNSLYHILIVIKIKIQNVLRKIYYTLNFMTKTWRWEVHISPARPSSPPFHKIALKQHTFNIKHHLHKGYFYKKFILA